jgi:hypothetical protein
VDSIASAHARLAALIRHRGEHDPAVTVARRALELARTEGRDIRRRIGGLSAAERHQLLTLTDREGSAA